MTWQTNNTVHHEQNVGGINIFLRTRGLHALVYLKQLYKFMIQDV